MRDIELVIVINDKLIYLFFILFIYDGKITATIELMGMLHSFISL